MLFQALQSAALAARKARVAQPTQAAEIRASLLTTLLAGVQKIGKDEGNRPLTDADVVLVVKRFLTSNTETLAKAQGASRAVAEVERAILGEFLPAQVAGDALNQVVLEIVATLAERTPKAMGLVMKELKARLGVNYDGNEARALITAALATA